MYALPWSLDLLGPSTRVRRDPLGYEASGHHAVLPWAGGGISDQAARTATSSAR